MAILNITNGDGAANAIKASSVAGDVLPWRDPMHHGPFPAGLDLAELSKMRADYLSGPGIDRDAARRDFQLRDDHLNGANRYNELVLWFEHDLLDQLQILQLFDWFYETAFERSKLTLICINHFDGLPGFRGLGELTPMQVATLWDVRVPITADQLQLAHTGWQAFRSPDPRELERYVAGDLSALPFLARALRRHLQEFPWQQDGLSRTERQILQLVARGFSSPGPIFVEIMNQEEVLFMGDWSTFRLIEDLCRPNVPLLRCSPGPMFKYPPDLTITRDAFLAQNLALTDNGHRVLAGKTSAIGKIQRDLWLGGVAIKSGSPMWMWDDDNGRIELVS